MPALTTPVLFTRATVEGRPLGLRSAAGRLRGSELDDANQKEDDQDDDDHADDSDAAVSVHFDLPLNERRLVPAGP